MEKPKLSYYQRNKEKICAKKRDARGNSKIGRPRTIDGIQAEKDRKGALIRAARKRQQKIPEVS